MQIDPSAKYHQGTFSNLFNLMQQHKRSVHHFSSIAENIVDTDQADWLKDLANYHSKKEDEIRSRIADLPEIPVKPSNKDQHILDNKIPYIQKAIEGSDRVKIARLVHQTEEALFAQYSTTIDNKDIPNGIRSQLKNHHKELIGIIEKAQKRVTIPTQKTFRT
jgi:hypothetical protein